MQPADHAGTERWTSIATRAGKLCGGFTPSRNDCVSVVDSLRLTWTGTSSLIGRSMRGSALRALVVQRLALDDTRVALDCGSKSSHTARSFAKPPHDLNETMPQESRPETGEALAALGNECSANQKAKRSDITSTSLSQA